MVASLQTSPLAGAERVEHRLGPAVHEGAIKIALAGNPNVGKSAIFNALTGLNADVSNYPGTTIDVSRGKLGAHDLIDTPGIYGVSSFNDEERIGRKIILECDVIVNVVSALSLDRDLFLTLQLADMGKPLIVVINQWDEGVRRGLHIDTGTLSATLGVPVITTVAVKQEGVDDIHRRLPDATTGSISKEIATLLQPLLISGMPPHLALLVLEDDEQTLSMLDCPPTGQRAAIYRQRRAAVNSIYKQVVRDPRLEHSFSTRLGRLLLHPLFGTLTSLLVCYLIFYQLLGIIIAGNLVDFTEKQCMRAYYEPSVRRAAANIFPCTVEIAGRKFAFPQGTIAKPAEAQTMDRQLAGAGIDKAKYDFWSFHDLRAIAGNALVGEYGVLTLTVTYLLALLFPLVLGFYFSLSILEDSGYLPRLAVLVDRLLNKVGLNGRAIIPLILGLGCVTMATVTTRLLSTRREKIIATALLGVAIPCSAQLGIVSGTLAKCGGALPWIVYGGFITGVLSVTGLLLNMVMPGKSQGLMIDLPPMRWPRMDNVLKKTWGKSINFMQESVPMFCLAGIVVTVAQVTGMLDNIIGALQPFTVSWLKLPNDPRIATTFVLGIVRRDFAAFGLTDVALTGVQAVVAMIVITLFVPCIATVGVMIKERGPKIALAIWFGSWIAAFGIGGLLARVLPPVFQAFGS
jgi:ferrous iron transport protein B